MLRIVALVLCLVAGAHGSVTACVQQLASGPCSAAVIKYLLVCGVCAVAFRNAAQNDSPNAFFHSACTSQCSGAALNQFIDCVMGPISGPVKPLVQALAGVACTVTTQDLVALRVSWIFFPA